MRPAYRSFKMLLTVFLLSGFVALEAFPGNPIWAAGPRELRADETAKPDASGEGLPNSSDRHQAVNHPAVTAVGFVLDAALFGVAVALMPPALLLELGAGLARSAGFYLG